MIVVDGRTDEEKLVELLATGAEQTALDFKSTLNLTGGKSKDALEFAKDAISMGNLPDGGYIVVGVDDRGHPAHGQPPIDPKQFDSAALRQRVATYVEAQISVVSQVHRVKGRQVVLIYIAPNPEGLPVPTSKDGQYDGGGGRSKTVFTAGEVLIREGTSNTRLRYAHWHLLLARYRDKVRTEARQDIDDLVRRVVGSVGSGPASVPLDAGMDDATLTEALLTQLEAGASSVRIQQFLNDRAQQAGTLNESEPEARTRALDQICLVAAQSVMYRSDEVFLLAVEALVRAYEAQWKLGGHEHPQRAGHYLDILVRVLALGALCVRRASWHLLAPLAVQPLTDNGYTYGSWLRHAIVMSSRAGVLHGSDGSASGGQPLSLARALVHKTPALRPDYLANTAMPDPEALAHDDWLLNSLCEFDLWWCLLAVAARRPERGPSWDFYPSCAAFHQFRAQPTFDRIVADAEVRRQGFGPATDTDIANALVVVTAGAVGQSHNYGGWWEGFRANPEVEAFVEKHATQDADPSR